MRISRSAASWLQLRRLPANVINGLCVTLGVAIVHLALAPWVSEEALLLATSGAVYASLPHLVDRAPRAAKGALAGGLLGCVTVYIITSVLHLPVLLHASLALLVFMAQMTLAWGQRAGPLSFAVVLAIVLSLATGALLPPWQAAAWTGVGAVLYAGTAWLGTRLLEQRYAALAVAATLHAAAELLRSRAAVLEQIDVSDASEALRWKQIDEETRLAALIQAARELVFGGEANLGPVPYAQLLFRAIELRDLVLTSRLDLDLLGSDSLAREIRLRLARSLRVNAAALELSERRLRLGALRFGARSEPQAPRDQGHIKQILDERGLPADDARLRLLPAIASRQHQLLELIVSIQELLSGRHTQVPLSNADRQRLAANETWPVSELVRQLSLQSPVFRHALRSAAAVVIAHVLAVALPWAVHPHWLVLSVAVVLRGNFAQTVSRRNERILGTLAGCAVAAVLVNFAPQAVVSLLLVVAVGVAHAYVNVRYTLTAAAGTLMALLQTRLTSVFTPWLVVERLADTVMGAGFAWAFSYVLPSWSRRALPGLLGRTLDALRAYADAALLMGADAAARQQLTRERAYEALQTLITTLRLSAAEPRSVRPPLKAFLAFIDHAQGLMAHLSSLRLLLMRRAEQLQGEATERAVSDARQRLSKRLELDRVPHSSRPVIQPIQIEVPSVPADRAAFPWLMRRIQISVHAADRVGDAGRLALAQLHAAELHDGRSDQRAGP